VSPAAAEQPGPAEQVRLAIGPRGPIAEGISIDHGGGVRSRTIPGQVERVFTATIALWPPADWLDGLRVSGDLGYGLCLTCGGRDGACWCD